MKTVDEMIEQLSDCIKQKVINGDYRILRLSQISFGIAQILIDEKHKLTLWVRNDKKELTIYENEILQEYLYLGFGNFNDEVDSSDNECRIAYNNFQKVKEQYEKENTIKQIEANIKTLELELYNLKKELK